MEIEINFAKHMNPLTELPGNVLIEQQLQHCMEINGELQCPLFRSR